LQIDGFASVDPEAAKAFAAFNEKLSASGIELYTWDTSPLIAAAEDAIHDAAALSRKINEWESRWPLNARSPLRGGSHDPRELSGAFVRSVARTAA
jgi:hypothetical protein